MSEQPKRYKVDFEELPAAPRIVPLATLEGLRLTRAVNVLKNMVAYSGANPDPWMIFPAGDVKHQLTVAIIDLHAAGLARIATGEHPATGDLVGGACASEAAIAIYGGTTDAA
jgi:hypothetical protein